MGAWLAVAAAVVTQPAAYLHSRPAPDAEVVSQAIYGTNVSCLDEIAGWVRVRTPDDYGGWMRESALRRTLRPYAASGRVALVETLFAHLYGEPDAATHPPLLTVPFETRLEVTAEPERDGDRWIEVRLADGRAAWIQRGDLTLDPKALGIPEVIALARRFLGLPYLWGGTSSFGFDCSGFTQMLCRRRGVMIPRDSGPQASWEGAAPVARERLEPGDLLFFGSAPDRITHTGFYMGGGEFIHATTHGRPAVQISRLDEPYWAGLFQAARRLR